MQVETKKSHGPDNILSFILKIACLVVLKSLAKVFNTSLETGIFPRSLKACQDGTNFQNRVKSDMSNYQPISVLSTVARVLRKLYMNNFMIILKEQVLKKMPIRFSQASRYNSNAEEHKWLVTIIIRWTRAITMGLYCLI